jgi:hypothetical protein
MMSGLKLWMKGKLERWTKAQRLPRDARNLEKVMEKLKAVRDRGYIGPGEVESLTSFFDVKKGEDDIRMVYDGTKSGLNEALWAPWFPLPTVKMALKACDLSFVIPLGCPIWPCDQHEPLICLVCLPLSRNAPWRHKGSDEVIRLERDLRGMLPQNFERTGFVLRQFLERARALAAVQGDVL